MKHSKDAGGGIDSGTTAEHGVLATQADRGHPLPIGGLSGDDPDANAADQHRGYPQSHNPRGANLSLFKRLKGGDIPTLPESQGGTMPDGT